MKIETRNYIIEIPGDQMRGSFEHKIYGDERGGDLYFAEHEGSLFLDDYDGALALPGEVKRALQENGFTVHGDY